MHSSNIDQLLRSYIWRMTLFFRVIPIYLVASNRLPGSARPNEQLLYIYLSK